MTTRRDVIRSVLIDTYGPSVMTAALVDTVDEEWEKLRHHKHYDFSTALGNRIWDFFAGGDTAYSAAARIIQAEGMLPGLTSQGSCVEDANA